VEDRWLELSFPLAGAHTGGLECIACPRPEAGCGQRCEAATRPLAPVLLVQLRESAVNISGECIGHPAIRFRLDVQMISGRSFVRDKEEESRDHVVIARHILNGGNRL
jgi:hypothetical protein